MFAAFGKPAIMSNKSSTEFPRDDAAVASNSRIRNLAGGGGKKVLHTLNTIRQMGWQQSVRTLRTRNACKSCGLGMGGQLGAMTNELGEFPQLCNKGVLAQANDIQALVPAEVFSHSLAELRELDAFELAQLGRLGRPLYKAKTGRHFEEVSWDWALDYAAEQLLAIDPARTFFYSSGRSSNEAGFLLQLFARLYGSNNINSCSRYCHQASSMGLAESIGVDTATVQLEDLDHCDLIFVIGANPASNHPRFIHKLKSCRERGGQVIVINPCREPGLLRYVLPLNVKSVVSGGSWIASDYLQPNIGSDLAVFKGIAKSLLQSGQENGLYILAHTEGFVPFAEDIHATSWEQICRQSGLARADIERVARSYAQSSNTVFAWGMGVTQHQHGVDNIEYIVNLALLRGMLGRPHAGLLPLRGHSNEQGMDSMGVKPVLTEELLCRLEATLGFRVPEQPGMDTLACLDAAHQGLIDGAVFLGGNLYAASPDSRWVEQALGAIGFKLFLTTTLNQGHLYAMADGSDALILPVTARDEEWQPTTQESMFSFVRLSNGGIDRGADVRPEVDILAELGQYMFGDSPLDFARLRSHQSLREAIAAIVPGMEAMADIDADGKEFHVRDRILHQAEFRTASGKARFSVRSLPDRGSAAEQRQRDYPWLLTSLRSEGQFNSIIYAQEDSYRGVSGRWSVLMNRQDMASLMLEEGDSVNIVSAQGRMDAVRVYSYDIPPGNVATYFPEANILFDRRHDPRSKTPAFKSLDVAIEKSAAA